MPTFLITGGHAGLGLACSRQLAAVSGQHVLLCGRSLERIEIIAQQLRTTFGATVKVLQLDTSSLASVRAAATRCRAMLDSGEIDTLQGILCNAGASFGEPVTYSTDGYEETFATNYLGHFLLVELLIDRMAKNGRVIFTASGTHDPKTMDGKLVGIATTPNAIALAHHGKDGAKPLSGGVRYTTSKLCLFLLTYELDRRLKKAGSAIVSIVYDPGSVPGTGLLQRAPKFVQFMSKTSFLRWVFRRIGVTMGTIEFSGAALARIATNAEFGNKSGVYYQSNQGRLTERRSSIASYDEVAAAKLLNDSMKLVQLQPSERSVLLSHDMQP